MDNISRLLWVRIPAAATRLSRPLGLLLTDGQYLTANPTLAVLVPFGALVAGLVSGVAHPDIIFTASLPLTGLLLAFGCLGAGVGAWTWLGYVIGDTLTSSTHLDQTIQSRTPMLIDHLALGEAYLLLALLVIVLPLAVQALRQRTSASIPGGQSVAAQVVLGVLLMAGTVFLWRAAAPIMVRPVYTLALGGAPTTVAVATIQGDAGIILVVEAAVLGGLGALLSSIALSRPSFVEAQGEYRARRQGSRSLSDVVPWPLRLVVRGLLTAAILSGLMNSIVEALVAVISVMVILGLGASIVPSQTGFLAVMRRIPLLVRVVASLLVSLLVGYVVVGPFVYTFSLFPILVAALLSVAVMTVAVPEISLGIRIGPSKGAEQ